MELSNDMDWKEEGVQKILEGGPSFQSEDREKPLIVFFVMAQISQDILQDN